MASFRPLFSVGLLFIVCCFAIYILIVIKFNISLRPQPVDNETAPKRGRFVVPNIVHYAWFNPNKTVFRFHHYISVLSATKHLKPDDIFFWHDVEPKGPWWNVLRRRVTNINLLQRTAPTKIYNHTIKVPEHRSDIVRLEALLEFGGIYLDLDVIVLKSFDNLRFYDMTLGYESPKGLCNGVILARPGAKFLLLWMEAYKQFNDSWWGESSILVPAKLAEKNGTLIHTEEKTMNYPDWTVEGLKKLYNIGDIYDWSSNYAIHLWYRFHDKEYNPQTIRDLNSTCGEIFRYTYYGSKDLLARQ